MIEEIEHARKSSLDKAMTLSDTKKFLNKLKN